MFLGKKFKNVFVVSEATYWAEEGLMDSATEEYGLDLERQKYKVLLILNHNSLFVNCLLLFCPITGQSEAPVYWYFTLCYAYGGDKNLVFKKF